MIFDRIYNTVGRKKNSEPKDSPYKGMGYVILNDNIEHQGIGGKKGYIDRYLTLEELMCKIGEHCIGVLNFIERRPDLFKKKNLYRDLYGENFHKFITHALIHDTYGLYLYPKALTKNREYYYIKIWQSDGRNGTYLGYFICSDECKEIVKGDN